MKPWLKDNNTEMYSPHNHEKLFFPKRFIRALKNKIYEYMTAVSKSVYIDNLDDIANDKYR